MRGSLATDGVTTVGSAPFDCRLNLPVGSVRGLASASLLLAMLMHSAINRTAKLVPSADTAATNPLALSESLVAWLTLAFLWIGAGYFLVRMRKAEPQRWADVPHSPQEPGG